MKITVQGIDSNGVRACFLLDVEPKWIPFDVTHKRKMKKFHPATMERFTVSYENIFDRGKLIMGDYQLSPLNRIIA